MYKEHPLQLQNYAGCITALDEQVGRLREHLKAKGVAENTMIWFCSDNGPESKDNPNNGSADPFRGRKRDLYEGGIRVPGLLVWPAKIKQGRQTDSPCVTSDYLPTVLDAIGVEHPEPSHTLDGVSLMPLIEGKSEKRSKNLGFLYTNRMSYSNEKYKIISYAGKPFELYDMVNDPSETTNIAPKSPELLAGMQQEFTAWIKSVKGSFDGDEYGTKSVERGNLNWTLPADGIPQAPAKKTNKKNKKKKQSNKQ